jgi:hypothetical protein
MTAPQRFERHDSHELGRLGRLARFGVARSASAASAHDEVLAVLLPRLPISAAGLTGQPDADTNRGATVGLCPQLWPCVARG